MPERPYRLSAPGTLGHKNGTYPRTLNEPPTASFTYSKDHNTFTFTDQSTDSNDNITNWEWEFGDGTTSPERNPVHTYAEAGEFSVTLTVTDAFGASDSVTQVVTSDPNEPPTASFSTTRKDDGVVEFTNTSHDPDGTIVSYDWDFGDGATSTAENPTHTYQEPGGYGVELTVTDNDGATDTAINSVSPYVWILITDFEDYTGDIAFGDGNQTLNTRNTAYHGSQSGYSGGGFAYNSSIKHIPSEWSNGYQFKKFEFYWREGSNQSGFNFLFTDDDANLLMVGGENPGWVVQDDSSSGNTKFYSGDGYNRWIRYTITFDWTDTDNVSYTIEGEDQQSGSTATHSGYIQGRSSDGFTSVAIGGTGNDGYAFWIDYIRYQ